MLLLILFLVFFAGLCGLLGLFMGFSDLFAFLFVFATFVWDSFLGLFFDSLFVGMTMRVATMTVTTMIVAVGKVTMAMTRTVGMTMTVTMTVVITVTMTMTVVISVAVTVVVVMVVGMAAAADGWSIAVVEENDADIANVTPSLSVDVGSYGMIMSVWS